MQNILNKIKSMFKKKGAESPSMINPHNHWMVILWVFLVISILLIIFSFYLLYKIKQEEIFQVAPTNNDNTSLLKENLLNSVMQTFDNQEKKEAELKNAPKVFKDPSL